ncbi:Hypothetical protein POVN_LOCUS516 [uncultured virus]|nr:Hypothetical protein POVN_LOCUS516 [uncultured virus]
MTEAKEAVATKLTFEESTALEFEAKAAAAFHGEVTRAKRTVADAEAYIRGCDKSIAKWEAEDAEDEKKCRELRVKVHEERMADLADEGKVAIYTKPQGQLIRQRSERQRELGLPETDYRTEPPHGWQVKEAEVHPEILGFNTAISELYKCEVKLRAELAAARAGTPHYSYQLDRTKFSIHLREDDFRCAREKRRVYEDALAQAKRELIVKEALPRLLPLAKEAATHTKLFEKPIMVELPASFFFAILERLKL